MRNRVKKVLARTRWFPITPIRRRPALVWKTGSARHRSGKSLSPLGTGTVFPEFDTERERSLSVLFVFAPLAFQNNTKAGPKVAGEVMVNVSKIIVISNIVVSAVVASMQCIFQKRFSKYERRCGTGNSTKMGEDANCDRNCDHRGVFSGRLNV
jgi:hypothetical protein